MPEAGVKLTNLKGEMRLTEKQVELKGTHADMAGGSVAVGGELDYAVHPAIAKLKLSTKGLDIQKLPSEWGLHDFEGKLKGTANLTLKIHADGKVEPLGGGDGTIEGAKFRGIPVTVAIHLRGNGKNYRFEQTKKAGIQGHAGNGVELARVRAIRAAGSSFSHRGRSGDPVPDALAPALAAFFCLAVNDARPKKNDPNTLDLSIGLHDVDIAELLQKLKLKIAYKINGKVTAQLTLSVPVGNVMSSAAYEFTGTVSSPE